MTMHFLPLAFAALAVSSPTGYDARPYASLVKRQAAYGSANIEVDLGYSVYQGYTNATAGTIPATAYAPTCPQAPDTGLTINPVNQSLASEDCLFVSLPYLACGRPSTNTVSSTSGRLATPPDNCQYLSGFMEVMWNGNPRAL